jgi:Secretion system C-terminal sorting domain
MNRLLIILSFLFNLNYCFCQDILIPYLYGQNIPTGTLNPTLNGGASYSWARLSMLSAYDGEYEIVLRNDFLFWESLIGLQDGYSIKLSYDMEILSFPFAPNCYLSPNGCAGSIGRDFYLPDQNNYNNVDNNWDGALYRLKPNTALDNGISQSLVSISFVNDYSAISYLNNRYYLPHTVIKHSIYVHCEDGSSGSAPPTTNPIYSISWIYDNTRGSMNSYPFCACNCVSCDESSYDLAFYPKVLHNQTEHFFNESDPAVILPGGTLNYYKYSDLPQGLCTRPRLSTPTATSHFYTSSNGIGIPYYYKAYFPPYALLSCPLMQSRGKAPAGYEYSGGTDIDKLQGIKHTYYIDKNLNLEYNEISTERKLIYNPSDVKITANDFRFPSFYSFRTIRGKYPTPNEVQNDNLIEYGGPFADIDVPVRTDLRCEDPTFDNDPLDPLDSRYASLYRLESGSKLTIEPCVGVFDAAFILNDGSTLDFSNFQTFIGYWEDNASLSRVAIDRNGGKLIRRYDNSLINSTLYLQDEIETEIAPNSYIVDNKIIVGTNVKPPPGGTVGPYIADVNSNVELIAKNYVKLDVGFAARAGSNVKIATDPNMVISQCPPPASGGSGNRVSSSAVKNEVEKVSVKLQPSVFENRVEVISSSSTSGIILNIEVLDNTGRLVKNFNNINSTNVEFDLNDLPVGMYLFKVQTENSVEVLKGVKN